MRSLIQKYNVPGPRYTSYPTVPYWDTERFTTSLWKQHMINAFENKTEEGISVYIHLPYCESLCTYCACNTRITVNHAVELPYVMAVLQEWELYRKNFTRTPKIKEIHLGGGTPTFFSPENLFLLLEGILCNVQTLPDIDFSFEGHPGNTTEEHLKVLYGLGFRRVSFGIQDFDPQVQEIINRKQTFEEVAFITEKARKIGYTSVNFDLVYGLPLQTKKRMINTLQKVQSLRPDRIAFYSYAHVPWIKPGQRKFTEADLPDNETKRDLYETGRAMLEELGYCEIGMDHFALPSDSLYKAVQSNTLHRNFMGYTSSHTSTLIGLGCSSISDTWTAFAQNIKTVEEYIKEVNNAHIPVYRGHILTEEDLVIRKLILNLMCRMETSLPADSSALVIQAGLTRLKELANDGLIQLSDDTIKVYEAGRPFLRNICMAFDARLHRSEKPGTLFSKTI
ncbi:MAG TPA: oxygen-independent coproporphyrinogen III oxidase [Cytophagaceae bacterium]|nr:oxygen-independent coproporphyrinogen III oxidase [Cytophagaceae bacterium]